MIENTLENKAKFFAVYWGQNIGGARSLVSEMYYNDLEVNNGNEIEYINLRQLSSITDEDAIAVARLNKRINWNIGHNPKVWKNSFGDTVVSNGEGFGSIYTRTIVTDMDYLSLEQCDFLRSRGYLLPWMGLTPDEIIGYGWAKYKED